MSNWNERGRGWVAEMSEILWCLLNFHSHLLSKLDWNQRERERENACTCVLIKIYFVSINNSWFTEPPITLQCFFVK